MAGPYFPATDSLTNDPVTVTNNTVIFQGFMMLGYDISYVDVGGQWVVGFYSGPVTYFNLADLIDYLVNVETPHIQNM